MNEQRLPNDIASRIQFSTLLKYGRNAAGAAYSLQALAEAANISDQALLNLLNGRTQSPRLKTARAICRLYGISLDYFSFDTEAACRDYLLRHQQTSSEVLHMIANLSRNLSSDTLMRLSSIFHWIQAADDTH